MKIKSPRFIHVIFMLILITLLAIFASCCKVVSHFTQYEKPIVAAYLHINYNTGSVNEVGRGKPLLFSSDGEFIIPDNFGISSMKITNGFRVDCYRTANGDDYISLSADTPDFTKTLGDQNRLWMNDTVRKIVITRTDESSAIVYRSDFGNIESSQYVRIATNNVVSNQPIVKSELLSQIDMGSTVNYTIAFWLNQVKFNPTWRNIMYLGAGDNNQQNANGVGIDRTPGIWIYPNGRGIHFRHGSTGYNNEGADIMDNDLPALGSWYTVVYTVSDNVMTGYINGQQKTQKILPNNQRFIWGAPKDNKFLKLFANDNGWPNDGGLNIQNMTFFNYAMTADQIRNGAFQV